jgi:hypothetical protein
VLAAKAASFLFVEAVRALPANMRSLGIILAFELGTEVSVKPAKIVG